MLFTLFAGFRWGNTFAQGMTAMLLLALVSGAILEEVESRRCFLEMKEAQKERHQRRLRGEYE